MLIFSGKVIVIVKVTVKAIVFVRKCIYSEKKRCFLWFDVILKCLIWAIYDNWLIDTTHTEDILVSSKLQLDWKNRT